MTSGARFGSVSDRPVEGLIVKYNIVSKQINEFNKDVIEFRNNVGRALDNGWVPLGGVQVVFDGESLTFTQSLISETLNFSMQRVAK